MRLNFKRLGLLGAHAARALARSVQLTSARFDLMTVVLAQARCQCEIAAVLCVAESVVSRMVTALEEQGLVRRETPPNNRRVRMVSLTAEGRAKVSTYANDDESFLPIDGRESAQGWGELEWMVHWMPMLDLFGLDSLSILAYQLDFPHVPDPPFWAMQMHHRAGCMLSAPVRSGSEDVNAMDLAALTCRADHPHHVPRGRIPSWAPACAPRSMAEESGTYWDWSQATRLDPSAA